MQVNTDDNTANHISQFNFPLFGFLADQFPGHLKQYYLLVENNSGLCAYAALQVVDFRFFDYINEKRFNKEVGYKNLIKRILYKPGKLFDGPILVLGHLLLSGVKTTWLSEDFSEHEHDGLWSKLLESVAENGFPGINYFSALAVVANGSEIKQADFSKINRWKSIDIYPIMELNLRSEWNNFADYFESLRSRYKKKVRSVLEKSNELELRLLNIEDVERNHEKIMSLFRTVLDASSYTLLEPESNFFTELIKINDLDYHVAGIFFQGELVAFFSWFNYNGVTEGHFLGYNKEHLISFDLYKFTLLKIIEQALTNGSKCLVLGRTATIVKADLGALPVTSKLLIRPIGFFRRWFFPLYYGLFFNRFSFRKRNVFND
jgi:hypothetical protein